MTPPKVKLGWALLSSGQMLHVQNVARGKACGCICPDCHTPLIARQGEKNSWHFQHSTPIQCNGESALHRAAKQVLENAAKAGCSLSLPGMSGTFELRDIRNISHQQTWAFCNQSLSMVSARQEVRVSTDLIPDVLVFAQNGDTCAVEILVTHKKTDIECEKYQKLSLNSLEIDLSEIAWDADEAAICEAILSSADRTWLFSGDKSRLEAEARAKLITRIESLNSALTQKLREFILNPNAMMTNPFSSSSIKWPRITEKRSAVDAFGQKMTEEESTIPRLTAIGDQWVMANSSCWHNHGVVNNRTKVDVYVTLAGSTFTPCESEKPALLVTWTPHSDSGEPSDGVRLKWINIERWKAKLGGRAEEKLQNTLRYNAAKKSAYDNFAAQFRHFNDFEKLKLLAQTLGIARPNSAGQRVEAWNTTWAVWKALVWKYTILRLPEQYIDVETIATDNWLESLTGWPIDPPAIKHRKKTLWFWLKDLQRLGVVKHLAGGLFIVSKNPPSNFKPWDRISDKSFTGASNVNRQARR